MHAATNLHSAFTHQSRRHSHVADQPTSSVTLSALDVWSELRFAVSDGKHGEWTSRHTREKYLEAMHDDKIAANYRQLHQPPAQDLDWTLGRDRRVGGASQPAIDLPVLFRTQFSLPYCWSKVDPARRCRSVEAICRKGSRGAGNAAPRRASYAYDDGVLLGDRAWGVEKDEQAGQRHYLGLAGRSMTDAMDRELCGAVLLPESTPSPLPDGCLGGPEVLPSPKPLHQLNQPLPSPRAAGEPRRDPSGRGRAPHSAAAGVTEPRAVGTGGDCKWFGSQPVPVPFYPGRQRSPSPAEVPQVGGRGGPYCAKPIPDHAIPYDRRPQSEQETNRGPCTDDRTDNRLLRRDPLRAPYGPLCAKSFDHPGGGGIIATAALSPSDAIARGPAGLAAGEASASASASAARRCTIDGVASWPGADDFIGQVMPRLPQLRISSSTVCATGCADEEDEYERAFGRTPVLLTDARDAMSNLSSASSDDGGSDDGVRGDDPVWRTSGRYRKGSGYGAACRGHTRGRTSRAKRLHAPHRNGGDESGIFRIRASSGIGDGDGDGESD
ncbi:hypothetical protein Vretifemale_8551, partial [Volvox reticuliferus]